MRTLTSEATAEQKKDSYTPFIQAIFRSHNGATTRTYNQKGTSTPHILSIQHTEGRTGGNMSAPNVPFPISAVVRLNDPGNTLASTSFIGYRCDIGWGINTSANGDEISEGEPLIVVQQAEHGLPGQVVLDLYCSSLWDMTAMIWAAQTRGAPFEFKTTEIKHIFMELLAGAPLENEGKDFKMFSGTTTGGIVGWDAGASTYTDESDDLLDTTTTQSLQNYIDTVGSKLYFGKLLRFNRLTVYISTAGVGTFSLTWEYWNGSDWSALSNVASSAIAGSANGVNLQAVGMYIISFDLPANMSNTRGNFRTQDPDDGTNGAFPSVPMYWVRARQTTTTPTVTTPPTATRIFGALEWALSIDTSQSDQGDDETPVYTTGDGQTIAEIITDLLHLTRLAVVLKKDGFHAKYLDPTDSADYSFVLPSDGGTNHGAFDLRADLYEPIPNKIIYSDAKLDNKSTTPAEDSSSQTAHGIIEMHIIDPTVTSEAEANELASRHMYRLNRDESTGRFNAPMNIGLEIWDMAQVADSTRTGETKKGRVTQIKREWEGDTGIYRMEVLLGSVEVSYLANPDIDITAGLAEDFQQSNDIMLVLNNNFLNMRNEFITLDNRITAQLQVGGSKPLGIPTPAQFGGPAQIGGGFLIGDPTKGRDIGPTPAGSGSPGDANIPGDQGRVIDVGGTAPSGLTSRGDTTIRSFSTQLTLSPFLVQIIARRSARIEQAERHAVIQAAALEGSRFGATEEEEGAI